MKKNIFVISSEDVQYLAEKRLSRRLTLEELERVKKGVAFGLECWEEVIVYAIDEIIKENKD